MLTDRKLWSVLTLATLSFFSTLWVRPADLMESRNFITAREIIFNNEWLITTLNGNYRFEKPPLPTWLTALTMDIFNNFSDEWLLRLPVALSCVLLTFYLYKFVDEFVKNKKIAFLSAFVLCTTFMVTKVGAENSWDAYPYIFMFISIYYFVRLLNNQKFLDLGLASLFLAFSLLSKGPIALYGMFIPFLISYIIVYKGGGILKNKVNLLLYLVIGFILAGFWVMAVMLENSELFLSVMAKEANTWSNNHVKPFYYYLHFFGFMGIWAIFTLLLFLRKWQFKSDAENKLFKLGLFWTIFSLILLSLVQMKKERYGFPIYVLLSIPLGILLNHYLHESWNYFKKLDKAVFLVQGSLVLLACFGGIGLILWEVEVFYLKIFLAIPFVLIAFFLGSSYKKDKNSFKNTCIYASGFLFLFINLNLTWLIEKVPYYDKLSMPALEEMQKNPINIPIYAQSINIENVWSVGQNIKELNFNEDMPAKFYILGNFDAISENYKVISQKEYRMFRDKEKSVILYEISKKI